MKKSNYKIINTSVRGIAVNIVHQVMEQGAFTNAILDKYLQKSSLKPEDKKLLTELCNGTVRMTRHLDWVLALFLRDGIKKLNPWLRNILRVSAYQIIFMDRIPHYAAVNEAVDISRAMVGDNLSKLCNGVLRNLIRQKDNITYPEDKGLSFYYSIYYSQPEWLVKMLLANYGQEKTEAMLIYFNTHTKVYLRNNQLKGSREALINELQEEEILAEGERIPCALRIEDSKLAIVDSETFKKGRFFLQNPASMLAAYILNAQPGEEVFDLCCGVGGKSTHIAERMNNQGKVIAIDMYKHKLKILKSHAERLDITIIEDCLLNVLDLEKEFSHKLADKIFLDAPCSGLGVLNRRADLRWKQNELRIKELTKLQGEMLNKASTRLKVGGSIVYATCTINKKENEDIISQFLKNNNNYKLEAFDDLIDFLPLSEGDKEKARQGYITILPGEYNTDGMFYTKMRRIS